METMLRPRAAGLCKDAPVDTARSGMGGGAGVPPGGHPSPYRTTQRRWNFETGLKRVGVVAERGWLRSALTLTYALGATPGR